MQPLPHALLAANRLAPHLIDADHGGLSQQAVPKITPANGGNFINIEYD